MGSMVLPVTKSMQVLGERAFLLDRLSLLFMKLRYFLIRWLVVVASPRIIYSYTLGRLNKSYQTQSQPLRKSCQSVFSFLFSLGRALKISAFFRSLAISYRDFIPRQVASIYGCEKNNSFYFWSNEM